MSLWHALRLKRGLTLLDLPLPHWRRSGTGWQARGSCCDPFRDDGAGKFSGEVVHQFLCLEPDERLTEHGRAAVGSYFHCLGNRPIRRAEIGGDVREFQPFGG